MWQSRLFPCSHTDDLKARPRPAKARADMGPALALFLALPLLLAALALTLIQNQARQEVLAAQDPPAQAVEEQAAPPMLTGLTATLTGPVAIQLAWDKLAAGISYVLQWQSDDGLDSGSLALADQGHSFAELRPGSVYTFTVTPLLNGEAGQAAAITCATPEVAQVLALRAEALDDSSLEISWDYLDTGRDIRWEISYSHERGGGDLYAYTTPAGQSSASVVLSNLYPHTRYEISIAGAFAEAKTRQAPRFQKWQMGLAYFSFYEQPESGGWEDADHYGPAQNYFRAGSPVVAKYGVYCGYTVEDKVFDLLLIARLEDGYSYVKNEGPMVINNDLTWWTGGFYPGELGGFQQAGDYIYDIYLDRRYFGTASLHIY